MQAFGRIPNSGGSAGYASSSYSDDSSDDEDAASGGKVAVDWTVEVLLDDDGQWHTGHVSQYSAATNNLYLVVKSEDLAGEVSVQRGCAAVRMPARSPSSSAPA